MRYANPVGFLAALALILAACQSSSSTQETSIPQKQTPAQSVQTPPQQTPEDIERDRLAEKRKSIAAQLRQALNDAGYDIDVGAVSLPESDGGPTLLLTGDIYKNTETRVESLHSLRRTANARLCPWGFRQVAFSTGLFSEDHSYSLQCYSGRR